MFGALLGPALLLLASSAEAQQTTEGVLTVQTSIPPLNTPCVGDECLISSTSICLENCIVEPCFPCSAEPTTSEIQMSIPEGETPIFTSELPTTSPEIITMTSVSTPTNETVTPITTSGQTSRPSSSGSGAESSSTRGSSTSSGTAPAQQSTGAAASGLKGDGTSYVFAMALSSMSMMFGAAWILL